MLFTLASANSAKSFGEHLFLCYHEGEKSNLCHKYIRSDREKAYLHYDLVLSIDTSMEKSVKLNKENGVGWT